MQQSLYTQGYIKWLKPGSIARADLSLVKKELGTKTSKPVSRVL